MSQAQSPALTRLQGAKAGGDEFQSEDVLIASNVQTATILQGLILLVAIMYLLAFSILSIFLEVGQSLHILCQQRARCQHKPLRALGRVVLSSGDNFKGSACVAISQEKSRSVMLVRTISQKIISESIFLILAVRNPEI